MRFDHDEKTTYHAVIRRVDCACPARPKRTRGKRGGWFHPAQLHRVSQSGDDSRRLFVPGGNEPTTPISQDELMLQSPRQ